MISDVVLFLYQTFFAPFPWQFIGQLILGNAYELLRAIGL